MKVEESLNVTFDESPPPSKLSPLVDDDVGEEETIRKNTKIVNTNNEEDKPIEVEEIVNIEEIKSFIRLFGITATLIKVSAAQEERTASKVSTARLMLLVYKLLLLVFRVNAAGIKLQLLTELQLLMDRD
ncbi:hypothetical protein Tco_0157754 [Tanacetum coccineum]